MPEQKELRRTLESVGLDDAEDVFFAKDETILTVDLDLGAGILAEGDEVADLDLEGGDLAIISDAAFADSEDLALHGLLLRGLGQEQAAASLGRLFLALDEDTIKEGTNVHLAQPLGV
ncbi:MAG: hypothetical protein ACI8S6_004474 [Myxococcota bacterium]|jgi:hypothetical protein